MSGSFRFWVHMFLPGALRVGWRRLIRQMRKSEGFLEEVMLELRAVG